MIRRILIIIAFASGWFVAACCADEDDEDSIACCRLAAMCEGCNCSDTLAAIIELGDEDACDTALADSDVADGCGDFSGAQAIEQCSQ